MLAQSNTSMQAYNHTAHCMLTRSCSQISVRCMFACRPRGLRNDLAHSLSDPNLGLSRPLQHPDAKQDRMSPTSIHQPSACLTNLRVYSTRQNRAGDRDIAIMSSTTAQRVGSASSPICLSWTRLSEMERQYRPCQITGYLASENLRHSLSLSIHGSPARSRSATDSWLPCTETYRVSRGS